MVIRTRTDSNMLAGILISGIVAGVLSLLAGLLLEVGVTLAAVGYVAGGLCGCAAFVQLAIVRGSGELG